MSPEEIIPEIILDTPDELARIRGTASDSDHRQDTRLTEIQKIVRRVDREPRPQETRSLAIPPFTRPLRPAPGRIRHRPNRPRRRIDRWNLSRLNQRLSGMDFRLENQRELPQRI